MAAQVISREWRAARTLEGAETAQRVEYTFVRTPRDQKRKCFLEGFFVTDDGQLVESCGLTGESYLRRYPLRGGPLVENKLEKVFAEGIVANGDKFWMLTYQAKVIMELDQNFNRIRTLPWTHGEGWGFATDGCVLYANTGKDFILHLSKETGELIKKVQVTKNGVPQKMINEMEYVTPYLWANIWLTNTLVAMDPHTGHILKEVSLDKLGVRWSGNDTPNGIAYHAQHIGALSLLVTGKNWDSLYTLTFESPADLCGGTPDTLTTQDICPSAPPSPCWGSQDNVGAPRTYPGDLVLPATIAPLGPHPTESGSQILVVPGSFVDHAVGIVAGLLVVIALFILCRARSLRSAPSIDARTPENQTLRLSF